jgi:hypothetical protein
VQQQLRYLDLAHVHGPRPAWELASRNGLTAVDLLELKSALTRLEPRTRTDSRGYRITVETRFQLCQQEKRALARRLMAEGCDDRRRWRDQLELSRTMWWRIRREFEQAQNGGQTPLSQPSPQAGKAVSKRPNPTHTPRSVQSEKELFLSETERERRARHLRDQPGLGVCGSQTYRTSPEPVDRLDPTTHLGVHFKRTIPKGRAFVDWVLERGGLVAVCDALLDEFTWPEIRAHFFAASFYTWAPSVETLQGL